MGDPQPSRLGGVQQLQQVLHLHAGRLGAGAVHPQHQTSAVPGRYHIPTTQNLHDQLAPSLSCIAMPISPVVKQALTSSIWGPFASSRIINMTGVCQLALDLRLSRQISLLLFCCKGQSAPSACPPVSCSVMLRQHAKCCVHCYAATARESACRQGYCPPRPSTRAEAADASQAELMRTLNLTLIQTPP